MVFGLSLQRCLPPLLAAAGIDEAVVSDDLMARLLFLTVLRVPPKSPNSKEDSKIALLTSKLREAFTTANTAMDSRLGFISMLKSK